jgi:putative Mn2+ efflux pump MntP
VGLINTLLVASSLAVDSCVVALARGLAERRPRARDALVVGAAFGVAQGVMPVLGAVGGRVTSELFTRVDHWVAFGVLAALGVKSLLEARRADATPASASAGAFSLVLAALATSIDAAAAGFSFSLIGEPIAPLAWFAASITACGSAACFIGGRSLGARHRRIGLVLGGLVLIAIGLNVLREHSDHL